MNTMIWGPLLWRISHTVSFTPANIKHPNQYRALQSLYYTSLQYVLPCSFCRSSYISFFRILPSITEQTTDIRRWVYDMHNLVNQKLEYPSPLTFDCLLKRHTLRTISCAPHDITSFLAILALNYEENESDVNLKVKHAIATFIWTVFNLLYLHDAKWGKIGIDFCEKHPPMFNSRTDFAEWVEKLTRKNIASYEIVRAKICKDKSCK